MFVQAFSFAFLFIAFVFGISMQLPIHEEMSIPSPKHSLSAESKQLSFPRSPTHSTDAMIEKFSSMAITPPYKQALRQEVKKSQIDQLSQQPSHSKSLTKAPVRKLQRMGKIRMERGHALSPYARPSA